MKHMRVDVKSYLVNHDHIDDYSGIFTREDGTELSPREAKGLMIEMYARGHKYIPMDNCPNFDKKKGYFV